METQTSNNTMLKIVLTAAVLLGGAGFLVYSSLDHAQHYQMVNELYASDMSQWEGKELKVHGYVEAGSIVEKVVNQEMHRTFILQKDGKRIRVFSTGPKPDTFKDMSEVVATGQLVKRETQTALAKDMGVPLETDMDYVVDSTELLAKCPSKYDGANVNNAKNVDKPFSSNGN
jgi:cytochrome c-type biogenesis protein CcmE|nr:cytochrome c maturation protein CcmE [Kofleriaceae bacterium]